jgi:hypothetical protein
LKTPLNFKPFASLYPVFIARTRKWGSCGGNGEEKEQESDTEIECIVQFGEEREKGRNQSAKQKEEYRYLKFLDK